MNVRYAKLGRVCLSIDKFAEEFIKFAEAGVETITVGANDPILMKYKDQIFKIIQKRYGQDLNMQIIPFLGALKFIPDELFHKLLGNIDRVVLTIDRKTDSILAISGVKKHHGQDRVQLFALKPLEKGSLLGQAKATIAASDQQIEHIFSGNYFMESSLDLFEKIHRMYALYKKGHPDSKANLYIYPAYVSAMVLPGRKIRITDDGVIYEKMVHRAGTIAKKILVGSVPVISNINGYDTIEEASQHAKYQGKILQGNHGDIKVMDFDPNLWKVKEFSLFG